MVLVIDLTQNPKTQLPVGWVSRGRSLAPTAFLRGTLEAGAAAAVFSLIKIISDPPSLESLLVVSRVATMLPWHSAQTQIVALTGLVALFYVLKNLFALGVEYFSHKVVGESVVAL